MIFMKKVFSFQLALVLMLLCGYTGIQENIENYTSFDATATLRAQSDNEGEASRAANEITKRTLHCTNLNFGKVDNTFYTAEVLLGFGKEVIPSRNEIAAALFRTDYNGAGTKSTRNDNIFA